MEVYYSYIKCDMSQIVPVCVLLINVRVVPVRYVLLIYVRVEYKIREPLDLKTR